MVNRSKGTLRVEGVDHVVAIEGDVAVVVAVVAGGVGVPDEVEPVLGEPLAEVRARRAGGRPAVS